MFGSLRRSSWAQHCVGCHNSHPESPKRDWKVGDVRGIQEIIIATSMAANIFSFKYLLGYFVFMAVLGLRLSSASSAASGDHRGHEPRARKHQRFLANVAMKISRYLSPQIYSSIFSGKKDVAIQTERKKLTIFFSDIEDFTATTERLQPEEITSSQRVPHGDVQHRGQARRHGRQIHRRRHVIFFGDPETKGAAEDAKACLAMAVDMQGRMAELNAQWRRRGIEHPFRVRMGINTGYCNVGNFGSEDRMDYTIIGAEANLAAAPAIDCRTGPHRVQL